MVLDREVDQWYWTAWTLSGENAWYADVIYSQMNIATMANLMAIKTYNDSFKPSFD